MGDPGVPSGFGWIYRPPACVFQHGWGLPMKVIGVGALGPKGVTGGRTGGVLVHRDQAQRDYR